MQSTRSTWGASSPWCLTRGGSARSYALNSGRVAAAPCIVDLQVAGLWVDEKSLEQIRSLSTFTDFGVDHHVLRVEDADRQESRREHLWDRVDSFEGFISELAHVDGMGRAIRRLRGLVLEIEKKKLLAKFSVLHAHPAWHAWIVGDNAASP